MCDVTMWGVIFLSYLVLIVLYIGEFSDAQSTKYCILCYLHTLLESQSRGAVSIHNGGTIKEF